MTTPCDAVQLPFGIIRTESCIFCKLVRRSAKSWHRWLSWQNNKTKDKKLSARQKPIITNDIIVIIRTLRRRLASSPILPLQIIHAWQNGEKVGKERRKSKAFQGRTDDTAGRRFLYSCKRTAAVHNTSHPFDTLPIAHSRAFTGLGTATTWNPKWKVQL